MADDLKSLLPPMKRMKKNNTIHNAKPVLDSQTCNQVLKVLKSGQLTQGKMVEKLEDRFSQFCNARYCAVVNSGTAALHSALYAIGIKHGDEVITSPLTFIASANAILMAGGKPVFADIDGKTFNLEPKKIENKITAKTKAIIPVHLYGLTCDMDEINSLARKYKLKVIEDACQAHGAEYKGKKVGSLSDIAVFSFYATKNMTTGEGGCVVSNNLNYIEKIKMFRHHGQSLQKRYYYKDLGYNYRLTDILAVIGIEQLKKLKQNIEKRQSNAQFYNSFLSKIAGIQTPFVPKNHIHVYHQYTIKVNQKVYGNSRDELINELKKNGVFAGIYYPHPIHTAPHIKVFGYKVGDYPIAEKISQVILSLPVHPSVKQYEIKKIANIIEKFRC